MARSATPGWGQAQCKNDFFKQFGIRLLKNLWLLGLERQGDWGLRYNTTHYEHMNAHD